MKERGGKDFVPRPDVEDEEKKCSKHVMELEGDEQCSWLLNQACIQIGWDRPGAYSNMALLKGVTIVYSGSE